MYICKLWTLKISNYTPKKDNKFNSIMHFTRSNNPIYTIKKLITHCYRELLILGVKVKFHYIFIY
jgi:hypothetical protein